MTMPPDNALLEKPVAEPAVSHDPSTPPALVDFMCRDWAEPSGELPDAIQGAENFLARRRALSAQFPGETLVIPTGVEKVRANDTNFRFRPGTDFYYLTGNTEPDCVLVMLPEGAGHRDVLFVHPNPHKTDTTFFTDRMKGELWVGPRLGVLESEAHYGVDEARDLAQLEAVLGEAQHGKYRLRREADAAIDATIAEQKENDAEFATFLSEQRLVKDELEIRELDKALAATKRAFDDVVRAIGTLTKEREVEGIFNLRARTDGNDVGYNTIAASGAHACILHWTRNDGSFKAGDLLLLDAGVEAESLYTADVTRTIPVSGRFTDAQRQIYDLVLEAQRAGFAQCMPGNDFLAPNRAAMQVLAHGLERLGILENADDALREEHMFYRRYSLHNVSHMLGLDVHDCAAARAEAYKFGKLEKGVVLTVEPGLYFQLDDLTVPARYRGIGVRIEDDVLITEDGYRILSDAIPREADDVERWVQAKS